MTTPTRPFPWTAVLTAVCAAGVLAVGAFIFWLAAGTDLAGLAMVADLLLLSIAVAVWLLVLRSVGPLDPIDADEPMELRTGRGSWPWA